MMQPSLFSQASGVQGIEPSVPYSNSSGEGSRAGIQLPESTVDALYSFKPIYPELSLSACAPAKVPDICRNRHHRNPQSEAANRRVHPTKTSVELTIYNLLAASAGLTSKEIGVKLGKEIHTFSGRISQLKADHKIYETGEVREGCAVLRVKK